MEVSKYTEASPTLRRYAGVCLHQNPAPEYMEIGYRQDPNAIFKQMESWLRSRFKNDKRSVSEKKKRHQSKCKKTELIE